MEASGRRIWMAPLATGGPGVEATQRCPHEPDVALHFEVLIAEGLGEA